MTPMGLTVTLKPGSPLRPVKTGPPLWRSPNLSAEEPSRGPSPAGVAPPRGRGTPGRTPAARSGPPPRHPASSASDAKSPE